MSVKRTPSVHDLCYVCTNVKARIEPKQNILLCVTVKCRNMCGILLTIVQASKPLEKVASSVRPYLRIWQWVFLISFIPKFKKLFRFATFLFHGMADNGKIHAYNVLRLDIRIPLNKTWWLKRPEARCRIVCFAWTHFMKIDMTCKLVEKVFFSKLQHRSCCADSMKHWNCESGHN